MMRGAVRVTGVTGVLVLALSSLACGTTGAPDGPLMPEELSFPMHFAVQCQSEICLPGTWQACDTLPVLAEPREPDRVVHQLAAGERFRVSGANTVVLVPGAVRVTRDTRQGLGGGDRFFRAGDTLFVLNHRGEGFFNVWYRGGLFGAEMFWPWERAGLPEYSGEVLQEQQEERWYWIETEDGTRGWLLSDGRILSPISVSMDRPCPAPVPLL